MVKEVGNKEPGDEPELITIQESEEDADWLRTMRRMKERGDEADGEEGEGRQG